jgi:hypothetical protein
LSKEWEMLEESFLFGITDGQEVLGELVLISSEINS